MINDFHKNAVQGVGVALASDHDGPLSGLLLLGPPGAGKSSLALSLVDGCPWRRTRLVADDMVLLHSTARGVIMSPPEAIAGLIEIRGVGPLSVPITHSTPLRLVIDLVDQRQSRITDLQPWRWEGLNENMPQKVPVLPYHLGQGSITDYALRIRTIFRAILAGQIG